MPNGASTLGMVFYELATNAVKYGALAGPGGHLDVSWRIVSASPSHHVALVWTESGGRTAPKDVASGFGINFIKRSIEYEMQGNAGLEPGPGGVRWTLEFPVPQNLPSGR